MDTGVFEEEKGNSLLLSLSKDITSCRTKEDVQHIVSNKLAPCFQYNPVMISLNEPDNLTHKVYIISVNSETKKELDVTRGQMKFFINDGIFDVIQSSAEPVVFDMDELTRRANHPFYVDVWSQLGAKEIIGFVLRVNNESIGVATLYPKQKNTFDPEQIRFAQAMCSYVGIA